MTKRAISIQLRPDFNEMLQSTLDKYQIELNICASQNEARRAMLKDNYCLAVIDTSAMATERAIESITDFRLDTYAPIVSVNEAEVTKLILDAGADMSFSVSESPDMVASHAIALLRRYTLSTRVVLMLPKTETSIRKVWMPKTVAYILREWQRNQILQKEFLGDEYQDHNLVIALENGRPCETKVIENAFNRLKNTANLPNVVFHSLRHSSTTYKLKLNHGDLKATQGDTGHARIEMITDIYAHILDEDRKVNAQKFEAAFYSNPDLREVKAPVETQQPAMDIQSLIIQLQQSPELLQTLSALLAVQKA